MKKEIVILIFLITIILLTFFSLGDNINASKTSNYYLYDESYQTLSSFNTFNTTFIDKDYKSNLFKEDKYYSIKTIEKKLKIKLLHNDNIDSKLYKADFIKTKDNKIAKIIFENVKEKKNSIVNIPLCIIINTQYSDLEDRNYLDIIENTKEIKYHINSINVDATIMLSNEEESGPMFSFFIYENIIYEIYMNRGCNTIEDLYEILNSFYK